MPTVVVTGAAGFLGSHVVDALRRNGMAVLPVSRRAIQGMHRVRTYDESPSGDFLIHLAEESDRSQVNRGCETELSSVGVVVDRLARRFGHRMIYASSTAVYGDEHSSARTISAPVVATDAYSKLKLANERMVLDGGGSVVRLSNLVGPRMSRNNVVSDVLRQIPGRGPLHVRDDTPIRDFLSAADAAAAFRFLIDRDYAGIVNVGSGIGVSIRQLAMLALACAGEEDREVVAGVSTARLSAVVVDVSETRRLLGWAPTTILREELIQLINRQGSQQG